MIGLDTNVLVRYIMQDDAEQSPLAGKLIAGLSEKDGGFVSLVTLVEIVWVLTACYDLQRSDIVRTVTGLLQSRELVVQYGDVALRAVRFYEAGNADFADCLIDGSGTAAGCQHTVTFDRKAARSTGMVLLSA